MAITVFMQSWVALGSQLTITLDALGNGAANQSDEVDNSTTRFLDAQLMVKVATTATAVSSSGTVEIYGFGQVGGSSFRTDTAGASAGSISAINARLIGVIQANSGNTTYAGGPFSIANAFGGLLPIKWGIIAVNRTGAQLSNSGSVNQVFFDGYYEQGS